MAMATEAAAIEDLLGEWSIDPEHSAVGFSVCHMMISTVRGRFDDVEGSFHLRSPEAGIAGRVRIGTPSISTGNRERDEHLRTNEFLEVATYPDIVFEPNELRILSDRAARVAGELTIKAVTRRIELAVVFNGFAPNDPWGKQRVSLTLAGTINRKEFGVAWNRTLETGGVLIGDDIKLELEVAATRSRR